MKSFNILPIDTQQYLNIGSFFMFLADLPETFLLEFIENITVFKKTQ